MSSKIVLLIWCRLSGKRYKTNIGKSSAYSFRQVLQLISRGLDAPAILKWLGDKELIYRHHESYSLAIVNLAQSLSCNYIDVRLPFLMKRDYYNYLCEDGIHPNERGYALINQTFTEYARTTMQRLLNS